MLWATAIYDLRLTEEFFWKLTPVEYNKISRRHISEIERRDYRAGVIAAVIANSHTSKNTKVFTPSDFFYFKPKVQTWQELEAKMNSICDSLERKK